MPVDLLAADDQAIEEQKQVLPDRPTQLADAPGCVGVEQTARASSGTAIR
jgi:hypothetical protein